MSHKPKTTNRRHLLKAGGLCIVSSVLFGCDHEGNRSQKDSKAFPDEELGRFFPKGEPCIDTIVRPMVAPVKQPSDASCWAAVWTMILSWKKNKKFSIRDAVALLGPAWVQNLDKNTGLKAQTFTEDDFLRASELKAKPPANYLSAAYVELLASHGPLWLNTGDGILNHATLLIGARTYADGRINFLFVDPAEGQFTQKTDSAFFEEFEREARVIVQHGLKWDFRFQIFHW